MVVAQRHRPIATPSADIARFIAADVGGTHVRVGVVDVGEQGALSLGEYRKYRCTDYPGLATILEHFLAQLPAADIRHGVIASAGYPMTDGSVISANLPWPLSPALIQSRLGFVELRLVNDFEALAQAVTRVQHADALQLAGPAEGDSNGPTLVLGPGTGLGAAVWIPTVHGEQAVVLSTEAGQASLVANTAREWQVLEQLREQHGRVCIEHVLSGPGLLNIYRAVCRLQGTEPQLASPAAVSEAALHAQDPAAREALTLFCDWLGSVCGDLALIYGIRNGVYLAGGVLPHLRSFLPHSNFLPRFLDKGPMRDALQRIPVKLIEHGQLGVIGAAHRYLEIRKDPRITATA